MGRKRTAPPVIKKKKIIVGAPKNPGEKTIAKEPLLHIHLYADVRKRMKKKVKELPNYQIIKIATQILEGVSDWVVENPEGFRMPYDMGYLAISKYVMVPFKEDRFEIINRIKNISPDSITERFREIILKKYSREITRTEAEIFVNNGKVFAVPMWYNQRNCSIKKAPVFKWMRNVYMQKKIKKSDKTKFHYYNFSDFYDYKVKAMDKFKI